MYLSCIAHTPMFYIVFIYVFEIETFISMCFLYEDAKNASSFVFCIRIYLGFETLKHLLPYVLCLKMRIRILYCACFIFAFVLFFFVFFRTLWTGKIFPWRLRDNIFASWNHRYFISEIKYLFMFLISKCSYLCTYLGLYMYICCTFLIVSSQFIVVFILITYCCQSNKKHQNYPKSYIQTRRNWSWIGLIQTKFGLWIHFFDRFSTKRNSVGCYEVQRSLTH